MRSQESGVRSQNEEGASPVAHADSVLLTPGSSSPDTGQILADILVGGELKIHLIGVAGSGMSGIAALLMALATLSTAWCGYQSAAWTAAEQSLDE